MTAFDQVEFILRGDEFPEKLLESAAYSAVSILNYFQSDSL